MNKKVRVGDVVTIPGEGAFKVLRVCYGYIHAMSEAEGYAHSRKVISALHGGRALVLERVAVESIPDRKDA